MTIDDAIISAVKEGYRVRSFDGLEMYYSGANTEWSVWTRTDNDSSFMVRIEESFLDPCFWQALGRALWCDDEVITVHKFDNGRPTVVTRAGQHWLFHWHRFIDYLAEGNPAESFFESLSSYRIIPMYEYKNQSHVRLR